MLGQLLSHAIAVSIGFINLVDGYDNRHAGIARVMNRLDSLRLNAIVRRDH